MVSKSVFVAVLGLAVALPAIRTLHAQDMLKIDKASYGYAGERKDVSDDVVKLCDGKATCKFPVKNETFASQRAGRPVAGKRQGCDGLLEMRDDRPQAAIRRGTYRFCRLRSLDRGPAAAATQIERWRVAGARRLALPQFHCRDCRCDGRVVSIVTLTVSDLPSRRIVSFSTSPTWAKSIRRWKSATLWTGTVSMATIRSPA